MIMGSWGRFDRGEVSPLSTTWLELRKYVHGSACTLRCSTKYRFVFFMTHLEKSFGRNTQEIQTKKGLNLYIRVASLIALVDSLRESQHEEGIATRQIRYCAWE